MWRAHVNEICAHASAASPEECCGLVGGRDCMAHKVYPLENVASNPLTGYEAAPQDLFRAQREMRERGERLLAIYHSHPRQVDPTPSATDVRLAYYPSAVYFIIGLGGDAPVLRAFRLYERGGCWERVEYKIVGE
ncbi:MAG: M67 family metallopeptidase [Pyrinomonadaceae bacterium]|nr:M67 family metallopeptidase [Pyrinomonadaceae bacterium]